MIVLHGRTSSSDIPLSEALENCAVILSKDSQGIALLYAPTYCHFAKVKNDGTLTDVQGENKNLDDVFEVRAFNKTSELRWLNQLNGQGKAVLISEVDISQYLQESISQLTALNTIKQEYILWGEGLENSFQSGWGKLAKSRIGSIYVPITGLTANKRVYLTAVEYLKADEEYGNVSVVEERLIGLEVK